MNEVVSACCYFANAGGFVADLSDSLRIEMRMDGAYASIFINARMS